MSSMTATQTSQSAGSTARRRGLKGVIVALTAALLLAVPSTPARADATLTASCNTQYGFISVGLPHYNAGAYGYHQLALWYSDGTRWVRYGWVTTTLSNGQWYKNGAWYTNAQTWMYVPARGYAYKTTEYLVVNGRVVQNAWDVSYEGFYVSNDWLSTMNGPRPYCQM